MPPGSVMNFNSRITLIVNKIYFILFIKKHGRLKGVLYSILGPDLLGLTVAVEQLDLLLLNPSIKRKF